MVEETSNWYALFVLTGEEENVKARIEYRLKDKVRLVIPKRKLKERKGGIWSYVIKPLFPGYILVNGNIGIDDYYLLKDIPGLIRILGNNGQLYRIDEHELEVISMLICNNEIIEFSNILIENGKAVVVDGPLKSMEGYIVGINGRKGRAKIRLSFLGDERVVELGINVLQAVSY